jgi:hypothetical protein
MTLARTNIRFTASGLEVPAVTCRGQKPHRSDRFWCCEARMRSVSVTCAGVSAGYAHDRRGDGDRDAGLDRDMTRPAHARSREQAEADPDDDQATR